LPGPDLFEKEAKGLAILSEADCIKVPEPLFEGKFHERAYLVMEFIESGNPSTNFWTDFGNFMASLHKNSTPDFGLDHDNYIGSLVQSNRQYHSWNEFFAHERIMRLVNQAYDCKFLQNSHIRYAEQLCSRLGDLIPGEIPALIHGDLWNGNFMVAANGKVAIYDPAVYYGHREMDLAMTRLFGGFAGEFYRSYMAGFPLAPGWEKRNDIFQLYPLLVHLLLFGGHYRETVVAILTKYG